MQPTELEKRRIILHKLSENPDQSGSSVAKSLGMPISTVNKVIKRYKESLTIERSPGSGAKSGPRDKNLSKRVMKSIINNPGLSIRDQAKIFKTSVFNVWKIRSRHGYKSFRAIKRPNRTHGQNKKAKTRARLLYDNILTRPNGCILMDDETYVKMDSKQLPGQKF